MRDSATWEVVMGDVPSGRSQRRRPARGFDRAAYDRAARLQALDRELSPTPVPARITLALDLRGLHGDQVDRDLGVWDPPDGWTGPMWQPGTAVDRWEAGTLVPIREQIMALAHLTGVPWRFFYLPVLHVPGRVFVCERRRGGRGLTIVQSWVDHDGVLRFDDDEELAVDAEPQRPARDQAREKGPKGLATKPGGRHVFELDRDVPGVCRACGCPKLNRRHST